MARLLNIPCRCICVDFYWLPCLHLLSFGALWSLKWLADRTTVWSLLLIITSSIHSLRQCYWPCVTDCMVFPSKHLSVCCRHSLFFTAGMKQVKRLTMSSDGSNKAYRSICTRYDVWHMDSVHLTYTLGLARSSLFLQSDYSNFLLQGLYKQIQKFINR